MEAGSHPGKQGVSKQTGATAVGAGGVCISINPSNWHFSWAPLLNTVMGLGVSTDGKKFVLHTKTSK